MAGSGAVIAKMWAWAALKRAGIEGTARTTAAQATNYAKVNSPWNSGPPNTGNARAGLHGGYYWESPTVLKAYVAHSMSYGVYLELAHDRHYMILEEAISEYGQSFFDGIKRIMDH